jgi:hypothetical protein
MQVTIYEYVIGITNYAGSGTSKMLTADPSDCPLCGGRLVRRPVAVAVIDGIDRVTADGLVSFDGDNWAVRDALNFAGAGTHDLSLADPKGYIV